MTKLIEHYELFCGLRALCFETTTKERDFSE